MVQTLKTKGNAALKEKLKKQAGFTLVELLIVVAIIAILAAIAIPAYSAQMENAKKRVDESTLSSATSMAAADYLLNNYKGEKSYDVYQSTTVGTAGSRNITVGTGLADAPAGYEEYKFQSSYTTITIKIKDGGVIATSTIA